MELQIAEFSRATPSICNLKSAICNSSPPAAAASVSVSAVALRTPIGHVRVDQYSHGFIPRGDLFMRRHITAAAFVSLLHFVAQFFIKLVFRRLRTGDHFIARRCHALRLVLSIGSRPLACGSVTTTAAQATPAA